MKASTDEIVRRTIRNAERMAERGGYDWTTARIALMKILEDLEERSPGAPALERLRDYIARRDREVPP